MNPLERDSIDVLVDWELTDSPAAHNEQIPQVPELYLDPMGFLGLPPIYGWPGRDVA